MDRELKPRPRTGIPYLGHWWTLRATKDSITALAETTGRARLAYGEGTQNLFEEVVALADLDRDGVLDPVLARTSREGLAFKAVIQLSAVPSRTNRRTPIASFGDEVAPAIVQPSARTGPVMLDILDRLGDQHALRCVDAKLTLGMCPVIAAARMGSYELEIADRVAALSVLPDREQLAEWLHLLGASDDLIEPLLALAPPTSPAEHAAHRIAELISPVDERTDAERAVANAKAPAAHAQQIAAREVLAAATPQAIADPAKRAKIVRALKQLGADPAIIDEVERVK
jgi:hypothetical protein